MLCECDILKDIAENVDFIFMVLIIDDRQKNEIKIHVNLSFSDQTVHTCITNIFFVSIDFAMCDSQNLLPVNGLFLSFQRFVEH